MGAGASKAARPASRKYPTTASKATVTRPAVSRPQPTSPAASSPREDATPKEEIDPDAAPGGFSARLHQMGVVQPNPTFSPSSRAAHKHGPPPPRPLEPNGPSAPLAPRFAPSTSNTTLSALDSRRRLQKLAEAELDPMQQRGSPRGRRFVDMRTLIDAIRMRDSGLPLAGIEKRLGLEPGLLGKLSAPEVLSHVSAPK